MARMAACLAAVALLCGSADVYAQEAGPLASLPAGSPRVEVGIGASIFFSGGTMPYAAGMIDTRLGARLSRSWSVEGLVHLVPPGGADLHGFYRAQALWRFGGNGLQPFLAVGGAGEFARISWPEYRYNDALTGEPGVIPAGSSFDITAPWYPTASVGFEKVLATRLAVRAELTAAFGVNDYGLAVALVPAVSLCIPIGRYPPARR